MNNLRVVFLGSPQFAVPSLEALIHSNDIDIPLVVTQPDRPAGRGRKLMSPAVKTIAEQHGIPVYQPETLRHEEHIEPIRAVAPDIIVVVSYGEILRKSVLEMAPLGCVNVHPSLLPAYRGATPIQAAILSGDEETGVSIIKLVSRLDAGPVLNQIRTRLEGSETAGVLSDRLSALAAEHLPETLHRWARGEITAENQNDALATYTRELSKADAQIDWTWPADYIERFIRAMQPWPKAWTMLDQQRLVISSSSDAADYDSIDARHGVVHQGDDHVIVSTGAGALRLGKVQPAGKREMDALDWTRGLQNRDVIQFGSPEPNRKPLISHR
jgi:methionyl-tRNA formyltransferase